MAVSADDFLQDVASAPGPDERLGVGIVLSDVLIDGLDQLCHAGEYPIAQLLGGDAAKESLDHVQPRVPAQCGEFRCSLRREPVFHRVRYFLAKFGVTTFLPEKATHHKLGIRYSDPVLPI